MSTMTTAAPSRHPTISEPPMPLWLVTWVGATMIVLILNFDSIMWNRVPVSFASLGPVGGGIDLEAVKAITMLVSALTPLVIGLVTATFAGVAKVILARKGKPDDQTGQ